MNIPVESVLFDLDGTLLDTHKDLCGALNQVLENHQRPLLSLDELRPYVSRGAITMVCLAFKCDEKSQQAMQLWKEMLAIYWENIAEHTCFFPNMENVIKSIEDSERPWGIVTNKPEHLTTKLLQVLELDKRAASVVSGDTLAVKKPHPEPLLHACEIMKANPNHCLYIGDDERDILAGKAANMRTLAAAYGYIPPTERIENWQADGIIETPSDILQWVL